MSLIHPGWEQHRQLADPKEVATRRELRLMKTAFYAGFTHALHTLMRAGVPLDEDFVEDVKREVDEYLRSGE